MNQKFERIARHLYQCRYQTSKGDTIISSYARFQRAVKARRRTAVGSRPMRSQTQMKLHGFLFDERSQARASLSKSGFVAVRSASARVMTADHKLRSLS